MAFLWVDMSATLTLEMLAESPRMNGHNPEGNELQRSVSKQVAVRELRRIQELTLQRINDPKVSDKTLYELGRSYVVLREAIRIEKGIIKPGSRNVSVRELSASEQQKRLPKPSNRPADYLADAAATLARAQAMSDQQTPANTGDSSPK